MSIRPWAARERDLRALLERVRTDSLTYAPAGVSMGDLAPSGLKRRRWTTPLAGSNAFERAVEALRTWGMHRGAGLRVAADGPIRGWYQCRVQRTAANRIRRRNVSHRGRRRRAESIRIRVRHPLRTPRTRRGGVRRVQRRCRQHSSRHRRGVAADAPARSTRPAARRPPTRPRRPALPRRDAIAHARLGGRRFARYSRTDRSGARPIHASTMSCFRELAEILSSCTSTAA